MHTQKRFVNWVTVRAFRVQPPVEMPPKGPSCYPKSFMLQFHRYYQSHWNVSYKTKTNINFRSQAWFRPPTKCWVKGFVLPHKYHALNFYQRYWHSLANKNAKTNSNVVGHHLVSRRVISTPSDVQRVYRCPKRTFTLPPKYNVSVSMLL